MLGNVVECDFIGVVDFRVYFEGEVGRYLMCKKSDGFRRWGVCVFKCIFF